jgi:hypothetical protein
MNTKAIYIKQNADLRIRMENQQVKWQIKEDALKDDNKRLNNLIRDKDKQIQMLQQHIATREAAYDRLVEENKLLQEEAVKMRASLVKNAEAIQLLAGRLNKDSGNSSKPPSSDGFKKVIHNSRKPTDRKPGGQKGHAPHGLGISANLQQMIDSNEMPIDVVEHGDQSQPFVSRLEIDVRTTVVVHEHRFHKGTPIPPELINPISYGSNLKTMCVYLSTMGLMSAERVANYIEDITSGALAPAKATILSMQKDVASRLNRELEHIKEVVLSASVLHTDETPLKSTQRPAPDGDGYEESKHTTFSIYARTYSTKDAVYLTVNGHKDNEGIKADAILTQFLNIMLHDHDIKYYAFGFGEHGECNAHIVRYLLGILGLTKHNWANLMDELLFEMLKYKERDLKRGIGTMDGESLQMFSDKYDQIIALGYSENALLPEKSIIRKDERNLLERLEKYKKNHLLFINNYNVPFSNNEAERDLRWIKTQQKVSGCHRSFDAAVVSMKLMSFILTLKKRSVRPWAGLYDVLHGRPVLSS